MLLIKRNGRSLITRNRSNAVASNEEKFSAHIFYHNYYCHWLRAVEYVLGAIESLAAVISTNLAKS